MQCDLKYVKAYQDRYGKWHYYFRRRGHPPTKLRGQPGSDEFLTAYQEAKNARKDIVSPGKRQGTIGGIWDEYQASAEFAALAVTTRREMKYVLDGLAKKHGDRQLKALKRSHIMGWRDSMKKKPGAANKMLRSVRALLSYAILKEQLEVNPCDKIKLMKLGRHRAWSDDELKAFETKWPIGTLERMIFDLALYSGQRRADLAAMRRDQISAGSLSVIQGKTGAKMSIRVHRSLAASLGAFLPTHEAETIIAGPAGKSIHSFTMAAIFRTAKREAKVPEDCVLHGLRKTTARIMAEIGEKSSPITGHLTRAMQDEYERDASQKKMATAAIISWERASKRKKG